MGVVWTTDKINKVVEPLAKATPALWIGGTYLAGTFDAFLLGILIVQIARYFSMCANSRKQRDPIALKALVVYTGLLCLATSLYMGVWGYTAFVLNFGSYRDLVLNKWLGVFAYIAPFQTAPIQFYYLHKAFRLYGRSYIILVFGSALILLAVSGAIANRIMVNATANVALMPKTTRLFASLAVWLWSDVAADLFISALLWFKFSRSKTGWDHTDKLITKLIRLIWTTQLPPTLFALVSPVDFFIHEPWTRNPFLVFSGKVYAVTLMYGLNERDNLLPNGGGGTSKAPTYEGGEFSVPASTSLIMKQFPKGGSGDRGFESRSNVDEESDIPGRKIHRSDSSPSTTCGGTTVQASFDETKDDERWRP